MPDLGSSISSQTALWSGASSVVTGLSPIVVWTCGIVIAAIVIPFLLRLVSGKSGSGAVGASKGCRANGGVVIGGNGSVISQSARKGKPSAVPGKASARLRETYLRMRDGNVGQRRADATRGSMFAAAVARDDRKAYGDAGHGSPGRVADAMAGYGRSGNVGSAKKRS